MQETATFAAGCFWGVEELFRNQQGVLSTRVGYTGGHTKNPSYEEVCSGKTNHAEAVEVIYDPTVISYTELVNLFFKNHNPTTKNRQGPDVGNQYRSVIFYHSSEQLAEAIKIKDSLEKQKYYSNPIVTEIIEKCEFYPAEEYHQKYLVKRGLSQCHLPGNADHDN
jgi:peptide-methionine (S)-S-oxide reductase